MYIDEMCHTSLVLAVQYYLHSTPRGGDVSAIKRNIKQAFSDAQRLDERFLNIGKRFHDVDLFTNIIMLKV